MTSTDAFGGLFFEELVSRYVDDRYFELRPWLEEELITALRGDFPVLLLEGEPGAGKTALLASLARSHRHWLRYFIRRDSREPMRSGDARSFLFAMGHQFAALHPELVTSAQLDIEVNQEVEELAFGGRAVGARIEEIVASPFYRTALRVRQHAQLVAGELEGLHVGRLTVDERMLDLGNLQQIALMEPAERLHATEPDEPMVILVDAIDELARGSQGMDIVRWLATVPTLPGNVRVLLSSRSRPDLLRQLVARYGDGLHRYHFATRSSNVRADLRRYAGNRIDRSALREVLPERGTPIDSFVEQAVDSAEGNFQYLETLFRALEEYARVGDDASIAQLVVPSGLPPGLDDLYVFLLTGLRASLESATVERAGAGPFDSPVRLAAWPTLYQLLLGVLAVAMRPLTRDQLAAFVFTPPGDRWLSEALESLGPLLDHRESSYSLYHGTLAEFLTRHETRFRHPDMYLEPSEWHLAIVRCYRNQAANWSAVTWEDVDDYGLLYVASHLAAVAMARGPESEYAGELDALLCVSFMRAKRARFGSHQPFDADAQTVIGFARAFPRNRTTLFAEMRGRYLHALIGALAAEVPPDALFALARAGEHGRAIMLADLLRGEDRTVAYLMTAAGAAAAGNRPESELLAAGPDDAASDSAQLGSTGVARCGRRSGRPGLTIV
jgi:hypothetical protein